MSGSKCTTKSALLEGSRKFSLENEASVLSRALFMENSLNI